jgi:hypothetical protein
VELSGAASPRLASMQHAMMVAGKKNPWIVLRIMQISSTGDSVRYTTYMETKRTILIFLTLISSSAVKSDLSCPTCLYGGAKYAIRRAITLEKSPRNTPTVIDDGTLNLRFRYPASLIKFVTDPMHVCFR